MAIVYTQTDLDNLNEALLTGAEEVRIGDRIIRYRSQDKLLQLIQIVSSYLENTTSDSDSTSLIQATFTKGRSE
jgi:hypothetical protein